MTEPQIAHFVITLFNLALWDADKHNSPTRTRAWLDSRCELFELYCLPSMAAQHGLTVEPVWLVMFDSSTPDDVRRRIARWKQQCPTLTPLFFTADEVKGFTGRSTGRRVDFITDAIADHLPADAGWIITTNLDNDDSLADDTLARIQQSVIRHPSQRVISLVNGWQYFPDRRAAISMTYPHNHFLSLVEACGSTPVTVESMSHRRARALFDVEDIEGEPGWLEVVHGGNVSNELRITSRIRYRRLHGSCSLRRFGIPVDFTAAEQRRANLRLTSLFFKIAIWRLRRKLSRKK